MDADGRCGSTCGLRIVKPVTGTTFVDVLRRDIDPDTSAIIYDFTKTRV